MANFKLTQTGEQIQADLDLLDKNSATQGQVLTANGSGGASWQNASSGSGSGGGTQLYLHTLELIISSDKANRPSFALSFVSSSSAPYNETTFPQTRIACSGTTSQGYILQSIQYNGSNVFSFTARNPQETSTLEFTSTVDIGFNTTVTPL